MLNVGPGARLSNDVLYVGARSSHAANAPSRIYAVPLSAWDEVNGGTRKAESSGP